MLKKLLKYDLLNIFKFLSLFYLLSISSATLTRIFLSIDNSTMANIIGQICSGLTIAMIVNILINNLMRIWVRFKQNLYGDESYLTHTLPISKKILYLSKFLTSIITMFTSVLVIGLTLFIAYYSKENIIFLKNILIPIADIYNSTVIKFLLVILLIFFLEMTAALQSGYTGIILGHKKNNSKTVYSVIFGFLTYVITQIIVLLTIFVIGIFNQDIMNLFTSNTITNLGLFKKIMYIAIIIYTICITINYFINTKIFEKGVNVD